MLPSNSAGRILGKDYQDEIGASQLGTRLWPEHWAGAFLARKARAHAVDVSELIFWLQRKQHTMTSFNQYAYVSAMHGVMWEALRDQIRADSLAMYPLKAATAWCGHYANETRLAPAKWSKYGQGVHSNLVRECYHGIGHAVFYALAPAAPAGFSLIPSTWSMGNDTLGIILVTCRGASSLSARLGCCGGAFHSVAHYWKGRFPQPAHPFPGVVDAYFDACRSFDF